MGTSDNKKIRVALSARVSMGEEHDQDPETQLIIGRQYCQKKGYDWVEFVDDAHSWQPILERNGYQNREGIASAMKRIDEFDGFLFLRVDRITRDNEIYHTFKGTLLRAGKFIEFFEDGTRLDPFKKERGASLVTNIKAAVAEDQLELIRATTREKLAAVKIKISEDGFYISKRSKRKIYKLGRPSLLVKDKLTGEKKMLNVDEILAMYTAEPKMSIAKIADELHCSTKPIWCVLKDAKQKGLL